MDLAHAIAKHTEWKLRLRSAIGRRETMDLASIARDDVCELGQWLHGAAKALYGSLECYGNCVASHAVFHTEAAKVAKAINAQRFTEAESMLNGESAYSSASSNVAVAILRLKREAGL